MGKTKGPYQEEFPEGSTVQIADRAFPEDFLKKWKLHHELDPQQLIYANKIAKVKSVGFYHGGDELYELNGVPGIWHERCLVAELSAKTGDNDSPTSRKRTAWWWLLLVFILIPVPFGPWWLTVTSLVLCVVLAWLLIGRNRRT